MAAAPPRLLTPHPCAFRCVKLELECVPQLRGPGRPVKSTPARKALEAGQQWRKKRSWTEQTEAAPKTTRPTTTIRTTRARGSAKVGKKTQGGAAPPAVAQEVQEAAPPSKKQPEGKPPLPPPSPSFSPQAQGWRWPLPARPTVPADVPRPLPRYQRQQAASHSIDSTDNSNSSMGAGSTLAMGSHLLNDDEEKLSSSGYGRATRLRPSQPDPPPAGQVLSTSSFPSFQEQCRIAATFYAQTAFRLREQGRLQHHKSVAIM